MNQYFGRVLDFESFDFDLLDVSIQRLHYCQEYMSKEHFDFVFLTQKHLQIVHVHHQVVHHQVVLQGRFELHDVFQKVSEMNFNHFI